MATGETLHHNNFLLAQVEAITDQTRPYVEEITATTAEWQELSSLDGAVHEDFLADIKVALDDQQFEALTAIQTISEPVPDELYGELLQYDNDITSQINDIDGELTELEAELQVKLDEIQAEADKVIEKAPRFAETVDATRQQLENQARAQHLVRISSVTEKRRQLETVRADIDTLYNDAGSIPLPMTYDNQRSERRRDQAVESTEAETVNEVDVIFDGIETGTQSKGWAAHLPGHSEHDDMNLGELRKAVNHALRV